MAIPILKEIQDALTSVVDWLFQTLPRPILFLLFIAFLSLIGTFLLPFIFNLSGQHCIDGEKFTNSFYDLPGNLAAWQSANNLAANNVSGTILVESACVYNDLNDTNPAMPVLTRYYRGWQCTNCTLTNDISGEGSLCYGDAYPIADEEKSWFQRWQCESVYDNGFTSFLCEPPRGYFYNQSLGGYQCYEDICELASETDYLKADLIAQGFHRAPGTGEEPPIVGIGCFSNKPKLSFVGIDILNPVLWIMLIMIVLIGWVYFRFIK